MLLSSAFVLLCGISVISGRSVLEQRPLPFGLDADDSSDEQQPLRIRFITPFMLRPPSADLPMTDEMTQQRREEAIRPPYFPESPMIIPEQRPSAFPIIVDVLDTFNKRMQMLEREVGAMFRMMIDLSSSIDASTTTEGLEIEPAPEDDETNTTEFPGSGINLTDVLRSGNPQLFPIDYHNSTFTEKVINGTRVLVNQTVDKGLDKNGNSHFFEVQVVRLIPDDDEQSETTTESSTDDVEADDGEEFDEVSNDESKHETTTIKLNDESTSTSMTKSNNTTIPNEGINPADFGPKTIHDNEILFRLI